MNWFVQTGLNPWNEEILTHAQWNLVYAAIGFGVVFMLAHTLYVRVLAEAGRRAHGAGRSGRWPRACRRR